MGSASDMPMRALPAVPAAEAAAAVAEAEVASTATGSPTRFVTTNLFPAPAVMPAAAATRAGTGSGAIAVGGRPKLRSILF